MVRDRDDETGRFTGEVTTSDVTEAMRNHDWTDLTPREIADDIGCSRKTALRRLHDLEDAGRVKHRETSVTTLWTLV